MQLVATTGDFSQGLDVILPGLGWLSGFSIWLMIIMARGIIQGKGRDGIKWFLGGGVAEVIPGLNFLPFLSGASLATIIEDRLPEQAKAAVEKVTKVAKPGGK